MCRLLDPTGSLFGARVVANAGMSYTEGATAASLIKKLDAQVLRNLQALPVHLQDAVQQQRLELMSGCPLDLAMSLAAPVSFAMPSEHFLVPVSGLLSMQQPASARQQRCAVCG